VTYNQFNSEAPKELRSGESGYCASERCRIALEAVESSKEFCGKIFYCLEVPVVRCHPFDLAPDIFRSVEFRGIFRQKVQLDLVGVRFNPLSDVGSFVIRDVVGYQVNLLALIVASQLTEQCNEGFAVELFFLEAEVPFGDFFVYLDGAKGFDSIARGEALYLATFPLDALRVAERSRLLERGFVLVQRNTVIGPHFLLYLGKVFLNPVFLLLRVLFGRNTPRHLDRKAEFS
jgi:hypothetical protein